MLKKIFLTIVAIVVIFEEWLWDLLTDIGQWIANKLELEKFDIWLLKASPKQALIAFFIPILIVTPINIFAIFLLTKGHLIEGVLLEIAAKLLGTLLISRIFKLVKPTLLKFIWLNSLNLKIGHLIEWAHNIMLNSFVYAWIITIKMKIKTTKILLRRFIFNN